MQSLHWNFRNARLLLMFKYTKVLSVTPAFLCMIRHHKPSLLDCFISHFNRLNISLYLQDHGLYNIQSFFTFMCLAHFTLFRKFISFLFLLAWDSSEVGDLTELCTQDQLGVGSSDGTKCCRGLEDVAKAFTGTWVVVIWLPSL